MLQRLGLLSRPLRDRFGIPLQLNFYEPEDLRQIVMLNSKKLNFYVTQDVAFKEARRFRGIPRIAIRLLKKGL